MSELSNVYIVKCTRRSHFDTNVVCYVGFKLLYFAINSNRMIDHLSFLFKDNLRYTYIMSCAVVVLMS